MSYLDRLRALELQKRATPLPTEPTKAPSVGSVGTPPHHFQNIAGSVEAVEPLSDPAAEARRQRVLQMLTEHPACHYAAITDAEADPEVVLLTLAIRGRATCELRIPRDKYDGLLLLELIERHGATVH